MVSMGYVRRTECQEFALKSDRFTVLAIDDSKLIRENVRKLLLDIGVPNVMEAENGAEAVELLSRIGVDLIISDWAMPEMTGQELLEWVRSNPKTMTLPFVMLTAEGDQERVLAAMKAGVNNYIVKPFSPGILYRKIRQFLPPDIQYNDKFDN